MERIRIEMNGMEWIRKKRNEMEMKWMESNEKIGIETKGK